MHPNHTPEFPDNITDYAPWVAKYGLLQPYGKCQCGCGQDAPIAKVGRKSEGHAIRQPIRFVIGHSGGKPNFGSLANHLFARCNKGQSDECWEWTGRGNATGYGVFQHDNVTYLAHRASWKVHYGELPDDLGVLHKCDNPPCVNPAHLFLGTRTDNVADMVAKNRQSAGEKVRNAKLTNNAVIEIRRLAQNGKTITSIARRFGVSRAAIRRAVNRVSWKHVT